MSFYIEIQDGNYAWVCYKIFVSLHLFLEVELGAIAHPSITEALSLNGEWSDMNRIGAGCTGLNSENGNIGNIPDLCPNGSWEEAELCNSFRIDLNLL